jgi:uncharacterized membrane protein
MNGSTTRPSSPKTPTFPLRVAVAIGIAVAVAAVAMGPVWRSAFAAASQGLHFHFDSALLARQSLAVKLHIAAAVAALAIGAFILARPKGGGLHRTLGWVWVIAMAGTAVSSIFIRTLNDGALSYIHLITGWVLIALPLGLVAIRNRRVVQHRRTMVGLYIGGLIIAGALTFIPGRLLWAVFVG